MSFLGVRLHSLRCKVSLKSTFLRSCVVCVGFSGDEEGFGLVAEVDGEELRLAVGGLAVHDSPTGADTAEEDSYDDSREDEEAGEDEDALEQRRGLPDLGVELQGHLLVEADFLVEVGGVDEFVSLIRLEAASGEAEEWAVAEELDCAERCDACVVDSLLDSAAMIAGDLRGGIEEEREGSLARFAGLGGSGDLGALVPAEHVGWKLAAKRLIADRPKRIPKGGWIDPGAGDVEREERRKGRRDGLAAGGLG